MSKENQVTRDRNERGEDATADQLEIQLGVEHLHELRHEFLKPTDDGRETDQLSVDDFSRVINRIMKTDTYEEAARRMFYDICITKSGERWLNWATFLDHLIATLRRSHQNDNNHYPPFSCNYYIKLLTHNRRAPTSKIVSIAASSFIYVFLSKNGVVGILDHSLKLQKTYLVDIDDLQRDFSNGTNGVRRVCRAWVTDAQHMADCKKLVIGSTNRTLHLYDISAATHMEEFRVFGLPNVATCFAYWFDKQNEDGRSLLFFGDDVGNVHCLQFTQPKTSLFKKMNMEGLTRVFFMDLDDSKDFVNYIILEKVHSQSVVRLLYLPHNSCLISCSDDPDDPLVIRDTHGKLKSYVFKLSKGIRCFDFHRSLNLLVTGGTDGLVRFWNPYVPAQPTSILEGHRVAVIDARILPDRYLAVTYSRDMVLKTWDTVTHCCLQTLSLSFPVSRRRLNSDPEHGPFPFNLETFDQKSILVACQDYVAELKLAENKDTEYQLQMSQETKYRTNVVASKLGVLRFTATWRPKTKDEMRAPERSKEHSAAWPPRTVDARIASAEREALEEFGTYIFAKMRNLGGHINRTEMQHLVGQGLPFRALKISELDDVVIDHTLPMSDRMRKQGLSYSNEDDLVALNLNFVASPPGLDGQSSRRSSVGSDQERWSSPCQPRHRRLRLPSIRSISSSRCTTPNESHRANV